ncbi:sodium:solute symporter [Kocuria sp. NPDC057446]|uniref:sodium:solute symporter family protein n=1 Tax=Kocuria sp. NPDC057446 TaxID=3346137 RepID=UPI003689AF1D
MTAGIIVIFLFMAIPLAVGFYAATKSQKTSDDYFIQGRGMGSIAVFFTVAATWWSAFAFLGSNASFYVDGPVYLTAFAWNVLFGFLYFVVGKRIWYLGKRFDFVTPSDFLGTLFNSEKLRWIVGLVVVLFTLPYLQIQLAGGAYLISVASGDAIPFWLSALLFYLVIVVYVWVGGIRAVAWTDIIYGALIFFGLVVAGIYISGTVGGPVALFERMQQASPAHLTLPGPEGDAGYATWVSLCFITAIGALMGPQLWLRMYAAKNGRIFNVMPFLISLVALAYLGSVLVGWTGFLQMPDVDTPDRILPLMALEYVPFVMATVLLAAGAGAAMSTANSQIHAVSTVVTKDFYQRYAKPSASERQLTNVGRYALLLFSVTAYFLALFSPGVLVTIGLIAFGGTAQLIVPTLGALFWPRGNATGAIAGLTAGVLLTAAMTFVPALASPLGLNPAMWGLAVNAILFVVVSLMTAPRDEETVRRYGAALQDFKSID